MVFNCFILCKYSFISVLFTKGNKEEKIIFNYMQLKVIKIKLQVLKFYKICGMG